MSSVTSELRGPVPSDAVAVAADRLWTAHVSGKPCAPVRDVIGATDVATAYAVQEYNTRRWIDAGRRLAGSRRRDGALDQIERFGVRPGTKRLTG